MSLALQGVSGGYGNTQVLRDVHLVVPAGGVVALLGPNGAGKTTLLRMCSGLLHPMRGTIWVDGTDATMAAPHALVALGVCHVPEGRAVFPSLTVAENLRLLGGRGSDAVDRAVDAFPVLGRKLTQTAGTMSGGEQQMLALARSYLRDPSYVLLDEVSMGLAPKVVDEIFEYIGHLTASGAALLLVEQYVHKALELADFAYVINKGHITFAGEASELDADSLAASYLGTAAPQHHSLPDPSLRSTPCSPDLI
jgi:branched-chain amino acid transport system ATP-binding protein